jgi:hypothetical protein
MKNLGYRLAQVDKASAGYLSNWNLYRTVLAQGSSGIEQDPSVVNPGVSSSGIWINGSSQPKRDL